MTRLLHAETLRLATTLPLLAARHIPAGISGSQAAAIIPAAGSPPPWPRRSGSARAR